MLGIILGGMLSTNVLAGDLSTVEVIGNAIFIQEDDKEYVIPIFNLTSIVMNKPKKEYGIKYYGYYNESLKTSYIDKETYERLKRLLMKTDQ